MAENIDVNVNVNTSAAQRNLANLNKQVEGLGNSFSTLKKVLTGALLANFITGAFRSAQAAKDLSEQTGLAVQSVLGLRQAFAENASSTAAADSAMLKFAKNVSDARNGNDELAKTFEQLGVNVYDTTQTIDQQFLSLIDGLGGVKNQADQTALAMETMGKGAAGNFAGIAASVRPAIAANAEAALAVVKADEAAQKFESAIAQLQKEILVALEPLSEFVKQIDFSSKALKELIQVGMALATILVTFTAIGRVGKLISGVFGTIKNAGKSLGKTFEVIAHYWKRFTKGLEEPPKNSFIAGITKSIGYLLSALGALGGALGTIAAFIIPESVLASFKTLGQFIGIVNDDATQLKLEQDEAAKQAAKAAAEQAAQQAELAAKIKEQVANIREVGKAYKDANKEVLTSLDNQLKYLRMSEREAEVASTVDEIRKNSADTVKKLQAELKKLPEGETARRNAILETIAVIKRDTELTVTGATAKIRAIQAEKEAIDAVNMALDLQIKKRANIEAIKNLEDEILMLGMTTKEREKYLKARAAEKTFNDEINAITDEQARKGKNASESDILNWKRRRLEATLYYNEALLKQNELETAEENGAIKLSQYLKQREEDLAASLDPANRLIDLVKRFDQEIDNFVQTGKFNFKDMLGSWVKDWLAAEAKMAATKLFKQIAGGVLGAIGGGIGGFIGKIFGFAEGGQPPVGKPSIVGEKGPELFVPKQAGTIVPNNQLGNGKGLATGAVNAPVTNNYITNNINAIDAKSVAQLFAENRKTLLGSVKMAEREMPYMAR